ncbi:hypothetical protein TWF481_002230 [Arthrobotrys musiformis]|uniref:Uncharacterized protein n=1 Tax=Arthrobotrys musiformis TaxID=47236 RepID=A0AAV9VV18_9PEZI
MSPYSFFLSLFLLLTAVLSHPLKNPDAPIQSKSFSASGNALSNIKVHDLATSNENLGSRPRDLARDGILPKFVRFESWTQIFDPNKPPKAVPPLANTNFGQMMKKFSLNALQDGPAPTESQPKLKRRNPIVPLTIEEWTEAFEIWRKGLFAPSGSPRDVNAPADGKSKF